MNKGFWKNFILVQDVSGVARDFQDEILMIFLSGKLHLSKVKLDKVETIEACALLEVEEECGILNTRLIGPLTTTYHVYVEFGKHFLKESRWFNIHSPDEQTQIPHLAEQITAIEWTDGALRTTLLQNSYPLVIGVLGDQLENEFTTPAMV